MGEGRGAVVGVINPFRREGGSRDRQEDQPEVQGMCKERHGCHDDRPSLYMQTRERRR